MALPKFTIRQLLEAGVHFGHHPRRWNPKMKKFIYGERHNVHIIDLQKTAPMLMCGLAALREVAASGGRVLFVGTKMQSSVKVAEAAKSCGAYYINHRWLGGMMTNWKTVSQSIKRMEEMEKRLEEAHEIGLTKKEILKLRREHEKLDRALGGIRDMGGQPDILFVLDVKKDSLAVQEARCLNIPVVGIVDTNADPDFVTFPVPGNDDATRALGLYCDLAVASILDGLKEHMQAAGVDLGESENPEIKLEQQEILPEKKEGKKISKDATKKKHEEKHEVSEVKEKPENK